MDLTVKVYLDRAKNELQAADILKRITEEKEPKTYFGIQEDTTFYSSVIGHAYYSIFYSTKALLLTKRIATSSPDVHKRTFDAFKKEFVDTGILDVKLLEIYRQLVVRADMLLAIFSNEKWKRGNFTYHTISQANKEPAEESLNNAKLFVANIIKMID